MQFHARIPRKFAHAFDVCMQAEGRLELGRDADEIQKRMTSAFHSAAAEILES